MRVRGERATSRERALSSAAGRTREEDHALCFARDLRVVLHHECFTATGGRIGRRHGGPHPLVELAVELLDEQLLLALDARVAFGEEYLYIPWLQPPQLHAWTDLMP